MDQASKVLSEDREVIFDWRGFMEFLMASPGEREKIGPAWLLLSDIYLNADRAGVYSTTYLKLAKRYGMAPITVKKWRKHLCHHSVIESFSRGHSVVFRLRDPFLSFLKPVERHDPKRVDQVLQSVLRALQDNSLSAVA